MARLQLIKHATIALLLAVLSACTVGPDYVKPKVETPPSYKEVEGWKKAEPQDSISRGSWWTIYNDEQLNALEAQVNISNQNLAAAEAQYRQALALVQVARAAYFPTATLGPSVSRSRSSANTSSNARGAMGESFTYTDLLSSGQVTWQPDLWGKVRRQVESSKASAQASDADLEGVRLSMQGQLAQDYFLLRTLDSQKKILTTTVDNYKKFLELTKNRYATGVAAQFDVLTAQTQLEDGRDREKMEHGHAPKNLDGGFLLTRVLRIYERALRAALRYRWLTLLACGAVLVASVFIYRQLDSDFLPDFDEGGFIIDYYAPPGTSLTETSRQLDEAERILSANPDVESYSRRLGAEMGMFITEPYRGDFAVKLKPGRKHSTEEVIAGLRHTFNEQFPAFRWEFPGILTDVIGDLQLTPDPVEIKLFSPDLKWLQQAAPRVEEEIKKIPGVVDTFDGLTETGPSINFRVRPADAARFGLSVQDIAAAVNTALLGQTASYVLEGDRIVNIRVLAEPASVNQLSPRCANCRCARPMARSCGCLKSPT